MATSLIGGLEQDEKALASHIALATFLLWCPSPQAHEGISKQWKNESVNCGQQGMRIWKMHSQRVGVDVPLFREGLRTRLVLRRGRLDSRG